MVGYDDYLVNHLAKKYNGNIVSYDKYKDKKDFDKIHNFTAYRVTQNCWDTEKIITKPLK